MSRFKRYERYKDSGVEWIGEIPEEWDVLKLKWIFKLVYRYPTYYGIQYSDNGVIEVRGEMLKGNGLIDVESCEPRFISEEISNNYPMTKLKKDDIVMSVRGTMGKIGLVTDNIENANITANLLRLSPNKNKVYSKWLVWLMESSRFNEELDNYSDQTTIKTIRVPNLLSINIPLPKYDEQNAIANFLYQKTAEIDGLIADKEKLIELLQEKRQAIITEAVTKGLNPNVRMKDSGIEWIGEIPEHWSITKMKYLLSPKKYSIKAGPFGSQLKNDDMVSGDVKVYNQKTVLDNDFKSGDYYIENYKYEELRAFEVFSGDLLVTTRGTIGKTAIVPKDAEKGILHPCLIKITLNPDKVLNEYINVVFNNTKIVTNQIMLESNATTIDVIYTDTLKNLVLPIPPLEEQKSIIDFVDAKIGEIDGLISSINNQIQKLKEYRQSLIFEAVTGKIDVRDYVVD